MPKSRRSARTVAFQTLFEIDATGHPSQATADRQANAGDLTAEARRYCQELVEGVLHHREVIDNEIQRAAPTWPLDQMSKVDKNILRLALFEVLFDNRVPLKAAINEAVELAKSFGSDSSARFVNGVLGSISAAQQTASQ